MDAPDRSRRIVEIHRRTFLKTAGAAGLGAAAGIEGILAARRAPAFAQATKVHLLQWVDFIPEGDVELRRQAAEYSKQAKVEVTVETINANDLQARITAAIQNTKDYPNSPLWKSWSVGREWETTFSGAPCSCSVSTSGTMSRATISACA